MAKKAQLKYYWDTVYKILNKEYDVNKLKLKAIDNFLKYINDESKELFSRSVETNYDTWVAGVALSDIKDSDEVDGLASSDMTAGGRIQVLDSTSAMENIDYSNIDADNDIKDSIVTKVNRDLSIMQTGINNSLNTKLLKYSNVTSNLTHRELIEKFMNGHPLSDYEKGKFKDILNEMINNGIGLNRNELSKLLEDNNYSDLLNNDELNDILDKAQTKFEGIDADQKKEYANAKNLEMDKLHHNTNIEYKRNGLHWDWNDGVKGKLNDSKNKLFKTVDGKLQFSEDAFNDIVSGLDLGTDEESKKKIKNMVGDLRDTMKELVNDPNMSKDNIVNEAMGRVFGTYHLRGTGNNQNRYDLKSVDKADEALFMKVLRDKGNKDNGVLFKDNAVRDAFNREFSNLDRSVGNEELGKYLRFEGNEVKIADGLGEEAKKKAEELKELFEKYNDMTYEKLVRLGQSMSEIINSHDTAHIINNYYMSNGKIYNNNIDGSTTNES